MSIETTPSSAPDPQWERIIDSYLTQPKTAPDTTLVYKDQCEADQPTWTDSARTIAERTNRIANVVLLPHTVRGYRQLGRRWVERFHDDYPQMIASTNRAIRQAAGDVNQEARLKDHRDRLRAQYRRHRLLYTGKTAGVAGAITGGVSFGAVTGSLWVDLVAALGAWGFGAFHGRGRITEGEVIAGEVVEASPALTDDALTTALRDIGLPGRATILSSEQAEDGTSTTVVDLPGAVTVTVLKRKLEALAAALGRDASMVDITKAGAEGRARIWLSNTDPFETPRPSPLLDMHGSLDAFQDGVPVAWNKRGDIIRLVINNSSFVIAGMTRSGKGVGASNLVAGAAMDPRINLRIVAGKTNGEWDAYARAGVAATYFKPNARRLLELLNALVADMNRRNKILGEIGKSKLTKDTISRLGGIEVLVIDELATYTRSGNELRDDILKALTDLSAVAAGAGILLVLITQYPEVDVLPQGLAMNCGTRWAMRVDNATQSNAVLGGGASGSGRDASKFDPPMPGLGWLVNPFAGVTDKARSFDLDEDERGEITLLMERAADIRTAAGRLVGQWEDPIERRLFSVTGLSSAAGGPRRNGEPGLEGMNGSGSAVAVVEDSVAVMEKAGVDRMKTETLLAMLRDYDSDVYGEMAVDELKALLKKVGAGAPVTLGPLDGEQNPRGFKRDRLRHLL